METIVHLNTLPDLYSFADAAEVPVCVPDVSKWQGNIDADKFIAAGAHGIIMRAGAVSADGSCYEDYQFKNNAIKFVGRIPCGAYWYYRPEHDPIKQADYFTGKTWYDFFPLVVDVESNTAGVGMANFQNWLYKFVLRVEANVGIKPVIYTRGTFWDPNVGNPAWAQEYDLWVARYSAVLTGPWSDGYYRPLPWQTWRLWQWSADGNRRGAEFGAESADIDLNRYNGTLSEFYAWCNWHQEPVPPVDEPTSTLCEDLKAWVKQCPWKFWEN